MEAVKVQMPHPTPEQLAEIRRLWPEPSENDEHLTPPYEPLQGYLAEELALDLNGATDQGVYAAGWSLLWGARRRHLDEIETALTNALELRVTGNGGGHAALREALRKLGYVTAASAEAERVAKAVLNGQL